MKKLLLGLAIVLLVFVTGSVAFLLVKKPAQRPASKVRIMASESLVERGRYLTNHVAVCLDCHSDRQKDRYGFPPVAATLGAGSSTCWDESMGYPGFKVCAPNLTPGGLSDWSDGEILRAIREGVDKQGDALFPVMPYMEYRGMSDEDAQAIVAYLRTLTTIERRHPERELPMPLNVIVKFMPRPLEGEVPSPNRNDPVAYGRYLTVIAGCKFCHTPVDGKHRPLPGQDYAGGQVFPLPDGGRLYSANLTPHENGLAGRGRDEFIALFKSFASKEVQEAKVAPEHNSVMPWQSYAGMNEEDLGAIYDFLTSLPPNDRKVERRPRPAQPAPAAADAGAASATAP